MNSARVIFIVGVAALLVCLGLYAWRVIQLVGQAVTP